MQPPSVQLGPPARDVSTAIVTWQALPIGVDEPAITRYTVHVDTVYPSDYAPVVVRVQASGSGRMSAAVPRLLPGRSYRFAVQASNSDGDGPVGAFTAAVDVPVRVGLPVRTVSLRTVACNVRWGSWW